MTHTEPAGGKIIHLEPQPNFPTDDALSGNAAVIGYLIENEPGIVGQSRFLQAHQRVLHEIATLSMRRGGVQMKTNPETYQGFTLGFSAIDFMTMLLKGRALNLQLAAEQFGKLYPKNPYLEEPSIFDSIRLLLGTDTASTPPLNEADILEDAPEAITQPTAVDRQFASLVEADTQATQASGWANRFTTWPDRKPNTFALILKVAGAHSDRLPFVAATVLGAQTAAELQDPSIAA